MSVYVVIKFYPVVFVLSCEKRVSELRGQNWEEERVLFINKEVIVSLR